MFKAVKEIFTSIVRKISLLFGKRSVKIINIKRTYRDKPYRAILYTEYPSWMTWMEDTEEVVCSQHGIIWYGQFSGKLGYDTGRWIESIAEYKKLESNSSFSSETSS